MAKVNKTRTHKSNTHKPRAKHRKALHPHGRGAYTANYGNHYTNEDGGHDQGGSNNQNSTDQNSTDQNNADQNSYVFQIQSLSHEGRGVALYSAEAVSEPAHPAHKIGKKVFIRHALAGETVRARIQHEVARFDEATLDTVLQAAPERVTPICPHVAQCGGCSLQHLHPDAQLQHKQAVLASHLQHFAQVEPRNWLPPLRNPRREYRRRARISVRYLAKQQRLMLGFRAHNSQQIVNIQDCAVLDRDLNALLPQLPTLLLALSDPSLVGHVQLVKGQSHCAMLLRHTRNLTAADYALLKAWSVQQQCLIYTQGNDAVLQQLTTLPQLSAAKSMGISSPDQSNSLDQPNSPNSPDHVSEPHDVNDPHQQSKAAHHHRDLYYVLAEFNLRFYFLPSDFTQVNAEVNALMVRQACHLLALQTGQRVLDLFCGLGNFSLPMASIVGATGRVVGVEGSADMVQRATANAAYNGIAHAEFYTQDLTQNLQTAPWAQQQFDAILLDPPRAGAATLLPCIVQFAAAKIVYVSCDPATLARDTHYLHQHGYTLTQAGIMDMFSHTSHVESIALFERNTATRPDSTQVAFTTGDGHGYRA